MHRVSSLLLLHRLLLHSISTLHLSLTSISSWLWLPLLLHAITWLLLHLVPIRIRLSLPLLIHWIISASLPLHLIISLLTAVSASHTIRVSSHGSTHRILLLVRGRLIRLSILRIHVCWIHIFSRIFTSVSIILLSRFLVTKCLLVWILGLIMWGILWPIPVLSIRRIAR